MGSTNTPGGNRLRALREYVGRTQLDVELDASLGIGYLQRVESGKVKQPERETLDRILTTLGAPYTERRDILELFGYIIDTPLPDLEEIRRAVSLCQQELRSALFPAYLLDCAHRLLTWNPFLPKLFKPIQGANFSPAEKPVSMLRLIYDPAYGVTPLIANPDKFFAAQIRALRYEMYRFRDESWYRPLIDDMLAQCPLFQHYWTASIADQKHYYIAARPLVPIEISSPDVGLLRFRLTSEPFAQDRRFRIIYYIPADPVTIQQCVSWLK